jgi:hypothetical protein
MDKIDIDSYSQGIICRNNWVFIHYTHEENQVEDGGAFFCFDTKGLKDVVFTVGYEDINEYLFCQRETPIFSRKCFLQVPNNEQVIQLRLPSLRISLGSEQVLNLIEVLLAFEETLKNKLVVEQQKATLEKMISGAGVKAEVKFLGRANDSCDHKKDENENFIFVVNDEESFKSDLFEQIDEIVAHKSQLISASNHEVIGLKEKLLIETSSNQEEICLDYLRAISDASRLAISGHYQNGILLLGLCLVTTIISPEYFGVIFLVYLLLILWFVVRNIIRERLTINAIEDIYELIESQYIFH